MLRKLLRNQRGHQKPWFEGQTTEWPKEKWGGGNYLENNAQETKDRATRTPLKLGDEHNVLQKDDQFLLHMLHPSCYNPGDK